MTSAATSAATSAVTPAVTSTAPDVISDAASEAGSAVPPQLRPYQQQLIGEVYQKIQEGYRRIAIVAGTGAGKTIISSQICAHARSQGLRLLFLVHLDVLVGQTFRKLQAYGLSCGFIKAGRQEDPDAPIQIASVQTMAKRDWWRTWPADVVFYDEAHTTIFSQIGQAVLYDTHPQAVHLAMTATPQRLGRSQLGDHLETLVMAPVPSQLQAMGFLAKMKYYGLPTDRTVDLGGVRLVDGDYDTQDLKNVCDRPELIAQTVRDWQRLTPNKRTIAFCVDVEHARHVADAFRAAGVAAEMIAGSTSPKKREHLYHNLGSGKLVVLTSCNTISIGFDEPAVEVGLLLRPTQSWALHHQQIGRVMRISPQTGKEYGIILDFAGNLQRLGFPEDIETYTLPVGEVTPESLPGSTRYKACPHCAAWVVNSARECPECGHSWAVEREWCAEELVELLTPEQLRAIEDEPTLIRLFHYDRQRAFRRGYAPQLADRAFFQRTGRQPQPHWHRGSIFGSDPQRGDREAYRQYLMEVARRSGKPLPWVITEFQKEFGLENWEASFF